MQCPSAIWAGVSNQPRQDGWGTEPKGLSAADPDPGSLSSSPEPVGEPRPQPRRPGPTEPLSQGVRSPWS